MSVKESDKKEYKYCCDPFSVHTSKQRKDLRSVSEQIAARFPTLLKAGEKLCSCCRKRLSQTSSEEYESASTLPEVVEVTDRQEVEEEVEEDEEYQSQEVALSVVNNTLSVLGQSPLKKRRSVSQSYVANKQIQIEAALKEQLATAGFSSEAEEEECNDSAEAIVACLKDKFHQSEICSEKVMILTIFGTSWTIRKIMSEFGCSQRMACKAVQLAKQSGILTSPNPKRGRPLPADTKALVAAFYRDDEISRPLPGKKDFVSVGKNVHVQKRLLLCNLKEAYQQFMSKHNGVKIGFSTFADLRPKECVLAGSSGTHSVCVCTIHQNVKLMMVGSRMEDLDGDLELTHYSQALSLIRCNPFHPNCALGSCTSCPGPEMLRECLLQYFDDKAVDDIQYNQWTSTDRSMLETVIQQVEEFVDTFMEKLEILSRHEFIAKEQSRYLNEKKEALQPGEFVVLLDFSENYSFIVQDAVQGYYWTNSQATLHPCVYYYSCDGKELQHGSLVFISECNIHDTVAVPLFQRQLVEYLKSTYGVITKITYFSDGCAGQYKNCKNFINLCYHLEDFGVPAEWHFFATSHGKGPCDGVGGTVKRQAAKASLQRVYTDQITTPHELFTFCHTQLQGITFKFITTNEWSIEETLLKERFSKAKTIAGTQRLHSFVPVDTTTLQVREYSASYDSRTEAVQVVVSPQVKMCDIKGYVTAIYDGAWWVACVTGSDPEMQEVTLSFLHPRGA
ncbi:hypothetical protein EMCRGX_G010672 [Ephydatia muelleri]|eukprot:Em0003g1905a